MKIKKRVQKLFVDALRSGKYKQTFFKLREGENYFCAEGVLCDLYVKECHDRWIDNGMLENLGIGLRKWTGMESCDTLIYLNDYEKLTFEQIADIVESWEGTDDE